MTYPKSSQAINKPKTHKNKTKRNSKTPKQRDPICSKIPRTTSGKAKEEKRGEGDVALGLKTLMLAP
jgi:hypothetical protein